MIATSGSSDFGTHDLRCYGACSDKGGDPSKQYGPNPTFLKLTNIWCRP